MSRDEPVVRVRDDDPLIFTETVRALYPPPPPVRPAARKRQPRKKTP